MTDIIIKDPRTAQSFGERMQREIAAQRAFDGARKGAQQSITPEDDGINIAKIIWPNEVFGLDEAKNKTLAEYDYYHHKWTSQLTVYIAEGFEGSLKPSARELQTLKTAAFLHDLGRREHWKKDDPGHQRRSADLAEAVLLNSPRWADRDGIAEVCKLIAQHSRTKKPEGPLLTALHDAECFERSRLAPNTMEGIQAMKEGFDGVLTEWAKNSEHQARWRKLRGWL